MNYLSARNIPQIQNTQIDTSRFASIQGSSRVPSQGYNPLHNFNKYCSETLNNIGAEAEVEAMPSQMVEAKAEAMLFEIVEEAELEAEAVNFQPCQLEAEAV